MHVSALLLRRAVVWGVLGLTVLVAGCSGSREGAAPDAGPSAPSSPETDVSAAPVARTVDGFRIQVFTSSEKGEADARAAAVEQWWAGLSASERPVGLRQDEAPVTVAWRQPYYRVRVGTFVRRAEAEQALPLLKRRFGTAFIVPDRVTVVR
ncbi:MAG: hypothetical protein GVY18_01490 [Bacteroidetes bacterium]|jgi:hypothetical protein|nr:hypothetical protein [Bacteroidota bacterium]